MKIAQSILMILLATSFSQANAQKILDKWEDLNNVNQIATKVNYIANEGSYDIITEYTSLLETYTAKLDSKSIPEKTATPTVIELIKKLQSQVALLNKAAYLKDSKEDIQNNLKSFNEILSVLISQCKIE
jgi:hypothetical protein